MPLPSNSSLTELCSDLAACITAFSSQEDLGQLYFCSKRTRLLANNELKDRIHRIKGVLTKYLMPDESKKLFAELDTVEDARLCINKYYEVLYKKHGKTGHNFLHQGTKKIPQIPHVIPEP